jgi:hypothetical protein
MNVIEARTDVRTVPVAARKHSGDSGEAFSFQCTHEEFVISRVLECRVETLKVSEQIPVYKGGRSRDTTPPE